MSVAFDVPAYFDPMGDLWIEILASNTQNVPVNFLSGYIYTRVVPNQSVGSVAGITELNLTKYINSLIREAGQV